MGQTIIPTTVGPLFTNTELAFTTVSDGDQYGILTINLDACKDNSFLLIEIPAGTSGTHSVTFLAGDYVGAVNKVIPIFAGKTAVIAFSSIEAKRSDGDIQLRIATTNGVGVASLNIKVAVIKQLPVVNH